MTKQIIRPLLLCMLLGSFASGYAMPAYADAYVEPAPQYYDDIVHPVRPVKKPGITSDEDPFEDVNRVIFGFNHVLDRLIFTPIARGYRQLMPDWGKRHIGNVVDNLSTPVTTVNLLLQGKTEETVTSFWRFTVNSSLGAFGLLDVATAAGMPRYDEDFGQTLAVAGVDSGPYIVLPLLGPSNVRDGVGIIVNAVTDPFNYIFDDEILIGKIILTHIHGRERLLDVTDHINETSFDPYAAIKSLFIQRRRGQIKR